MFRIFANILLTLLVFAWAPVLHAEPDEDALRTEAMQLVKQFAGSLKPRLKAALEAGGPVTAIEVCADAAPQIARQLSLDSGWAIRRVSLKARNASAASPDPWEARVLAGFDARRQEGVPVATLELGEKQGGHYRFMKAQGVEALCLGCHGQSLSPEVSEALARHYPGDQAVGYALGEVRGAFSLSKDLQQYE